MTGKEVSAFYQSPGVHELRYPNKEIKQFIQTYMKQLLAAYLRKSDRLAEYTSKYAPKGDIVGCAEEYANQDTLKRCLFIPRHQVPFLSVEAKAFLDRKPASSAKQIDYHFAEAKIEVDALYSNKNWNDTKNDILTEAKDWLYNSIGDIFADFGNGGVDAVDLFLAKVEMMTTCPSVEPLTPRSDESYEKLKQMFVKHFPGLFFFEGAKIDYIGQFLLLLKHDIKARIDFHVRSREKEIADAILEIVKDCRQEWIQIVKKLEDICALCYCETQETAKMMGEQVAQLNWVGCSPDEIADLKEKIRYYAVQDSLILAGELKSIIREHSDVCPKAPKERHVEIEDKIKEIEKRINAHAQNILNKKYIHDESISIVDRVIDYVREYRAPAGVNLKEAVQSYLVKNVMLLSQPLNTITDPSAGSILQKDLIVSLPQDDIVRLRNEISSDIDICIRSLGYMDPHSMLFVQTRRELSTDEIRDIHDYYEAYCDCNKNPAPSKYSGINLTAHLFDDSTWKEIVQVPVTADDVKNYIKLGQKMKVIVQYGKGKTSYWVFVDPVNSSASEKPDEQCVFGGPFVEEAKIMDALLKDSALLDELKNMLIETMCGAFGHGLQGQLKYLYFKDALQNPKSKGKKDPKIDIPDDIESAVANNMGWNL